MGGTKYNHQQSNYHHAYAAFVKNERFKQTIDILDQPVLRKLRVVK